MVAPGFRSRIATGLLVAAVVLPVPAGAIPAAASDRQATPADHPPKLTHPGDLPDDYAPEILGPEDFAPEDFGPGDHLSDLSSFHGRSGAGRGHAGHPGAAMRFPELPDDFPRLPDFLAGIPHLPSHHHFGYGRWRHHLHHPFGPGFAMPDLPRFAPLRGDGESPRSGGPRSARPAGPRGTDRAHPRPGRHAPPPKRRARSGSEPRTGPSSARPSPPRHKAPKRPSERRYEAMSPHPRPTAGQNGTPMPGSTDDESAATATPYALEAPQAPVERVLPMGAGLALTGLGLAFLALRLRRR
ncbi:hypothetical protein [Streptomyces sp. NPDC050355]|uniref:hypothetical protein n=1 Tax=Streptomyces sp. NPDC050355 TaxID=3365609 RepID=UPI0037BCA4AF